MAPEEGDELQRLILSPGNECCFDCDEGLQARAVVVAHLRRASLPSLRGPTSLRRCLCQVASNLDEGSATLVRLRYSLGLLWSLRRMVPCSVQPASLAPSRRVNSLHTKGADGQPDPVHSRGPGGSVSPLTPEARLATDELRALALGGNARFFAPSSRERRSAFRQPCGARHQQNHTSMCCTHVVHEPLPPPPHPHRRTRLHPRPRPHLHLQSPRDNRTLNITLKLTPRSTQERATH